MGPRGQLVGRLYGGDSFSPPTPSLPSHVHAQPTNKHPQKQPEQPKSTPPPKKTTTRLLHPPDGGEIVGRALRLAVQHLQEVARDGRRRLAVQREGQPPHSLAPDGHVEEDLGGGGDVDVDV